MLKKFILTIAVLFVVLHFPVYAESSSSLEQLDNISDRALEMTKLKRYGDSEKMLTYFSDRFLKETAKEQILDMDELRIITVAHNEALMTIKDMNKGDSEKVNSVTKFRLVVDAVKSTHQPLWTEMEDQMMNSFQQTKNAAINQDTITFNSQLNLFLSQYEMIYPSLKVDLSKETMQQLDTRIQYINQYRPEVISDGKNQKEMDALQNELTSIFDDMGEDDADPSLWWVIISTGSIIIMTLSYVGWRKYKGDQGKPRKEHND
ncbi:sporulation protein YpjB [Peribacillus sp. NPDC097895]|uniref:sporulation protein YpjB n=1 Tax=Peribacillus sp. NPDC097895 TaxID=3390619 RepID=UPI003D075ABA